MSIDDANYEFAVDRSELAVYFSGDINAITQRARKRTDRTSRLREFFCFSYTQLDGNIGSGYEKSDPPSVSHISGMGTP